jgi:hypothetical protein
MPSPPCLPSCLSGVLRLTLVAAVCGALVSSDAWAQGITQDAWQDALADGERPNVAIDPRAIGLADPPLPGIVAGFELAFLKPQGIDAFSSLPAVGIDTPHGTSWNFESAPRFWLGYTNADGLGVRARYFDFDHDAIGSTAAGTGIFRQTVESGLKVSALDLEVTQSARLGLTWLNAGGGLRYAETSLSASVVDNFGFTHDSTASFHGIGPTVFLEATRPIGNGNFALFATARGSLLFGDARQRVTETFPIPSGNFSESLVASQVVTVGELQLGGQWQRSTRYGTFFARSAFEAQAWSGAGNLTQPPLEALFGPFLNLGESHSRATPGGDFGMVGFTFSFGVSR